MSMHKKIIRDVIGPEEVESPKKEYVIKEPAKKVELKKGAFREKINLKPEIKIKKRKWHSKKIAAAILIIIGLLLFFSNSSGVTIKITPEQKTVSVDTTFVAAKEKGDLELEIMEFKEKETGEIAASGVRTEKTKASGQIVVYNAFDANPQTLVGKTRFETPNGKIYRISKPIIVPGATKENGKLIPGSIETTIFADKDGEEYNIEFSDFKIPGFKGSPKYEKFYARSKTPIGGGGVKQVPYASEEDEQNLNKSLEKILNEKTLKRADEKKPDGWLFYKNAHKISFSSNKLQSETTPDRLVIEKTADFSGALLNKKGLITAISNKYLNDPTNNADILNFNELSFELIKVDFEKYQMIFRTRGEADFIFLFDEEKLKNDLINNQSKIDIFKSYPSIKKAEIKYSPFWWRFFPKNASKIKIEVVKN